MRKIHMRIAEGTVLFECSLQPRNKESRIGGIATDGLTATDGELH
jgi:hypothetical protein